MERFKKFVEMSIEFIIMSLHLPDYSSIQAIIRFEQRAAIKIILPGRNACSQQCHNDNISLTLHNHGD